MRHPEEATPLDSLRMVPGEKYSAAAPCCRCGTTGQRWDRLAGKPFCPDCQEDLARGEGPPLIERTEPGRCCVCDHGGTIRYLTLPQQTPALLEMDLCPEHFRALLGRRLGPFAFHQVGRQLQALHLTVEQVFLLHDAFYDRQGRALQPVNQEEE
jgi:hypothetical protein